MKQFGAMLTALLCAVVALSANAGKLYKWVDKHGNVSYQDRPPPDDAGRVEHRDIGDRTKINNSDDSSSASVRFPVVLYSSPKCGPCDIARNYLNARKVPFTEKNAGSDLAIQDELRKKAGALVVPTISVGSKVITEYSQAWLDSELDQAGYPKKRDAEPKPDVDSNPQDPAPQQ